MSSNPKREAALKLLASTGIWRSNYAPPMLRFLWRLGFDTPPPHLVNFSSNALFCGTYFGVTWGLLMWFVFWSPHKISPAAAIISAVFAGIFFGLSMAAYYAHGRRKHNLPLWKDLKP
jgi:Family of unknown function (DUF6404)